MKKKRAYLGICLLIFAILSLSVFAFSANAAADERDNGTAAVRTTEESDNYALLKSDFQITGKTIAIAIGVSILATGITVFLIFNSYKTNGQSEPYTYKKKAPLELSDAEDIHVDTIVTRTKIERDNDK